MVYIAWGLHLPWLFGELQIEWTLLYLLWGYLSAVFSVWLLSNFGGFSPKIQRNIAIAPSRLAGLGYYAQLSELPLELLYVYIVLRVVHTLCGCPRVNCYINPSRTQLNLGTCRS